MRVLSKRVSREYVEMKGTSIHCGKFPEIRERNDLPKFSAKYNTVTNKKRNYSYFSPNFTKGLTHALTQ